MPARDETWQVVMPADDLWEGELTGVRLGAKNIVLLNAGGEILAFEDRCPHLGFQLSQGNLDRCTLTCANHQWEFDALTGQGTNPGNLAAFADEEVLGFDGVFIPGGHGSLVDFADNADIGRVLRLMHGAGKPVAALCHGPAALLSAPQADGAWMFDGYRMTAFTDEEENQTKAGKIGMPWYVEAALKNRGAIFDDGDAAWVSHVVVDRNLITGQNPGSAEAAAGALLKRLRA